MDRDECLGLAVTVGNTGAGASTGISATLATTTPGVTMVAAASTWADIAAGATGADATPFRFQTSSSFVPGTPIGFTLTLSTDQGPFTIPFSVPSGTPDPAATNFDATGPVAIPDNNAAGADLNVTVAGVATITKVRAAVRVTHTWDGDLRLYLRGPDGTTVLLANQAGQQQRQLRDRLPHERRKRHHLRRRGGDGHQRRRRSLRGHVPARAAALRVQGKSAAAANGTWALHAVEVAAGDTGSIQCVTLMINGVADGERRRVLQGAVRRGCHGHRGRGGHHQRELHGQP